MPGRVMQEGGFQDKKHTAASLQPVDHSRNVFPGSLLFPSIDQRLPGWQSFIRAAFHLTVLCAGLVFWISHYPAMADLPQHAAQVTALRELLSGSSSWADVLRINLFTPYLIGYAFALPLSYVLPIPDVLKLLLSFSFYSFVGAHLLLRRHFSADPRLDWLAIPGFFGFAYLWGFFTFLLAAPLCLVLIVIADRHARDPTISRGMLVLLVGVTIFFSHGLVFLFAGLIGASICLLRPASRAAKAKALAPFIPLAVICLVYVTVTSSQEAGIPDGPTAAEWWDWRLRAFVPALVFGIMPSLGGFLVALLGAVVLLLSPLLARSVWNRQDPIVLIPLGTLALVWLCMPDHVMRISFVYHRFALFIFPLFAIIFRAPAGSGDRQVDRRSIATHVFLAAICWASILMHGSRAAALEHERFDFDRVRAVMEPARRALYIRMGEHESSASSRLAYLHYGLWYQAENRGLVDYNFAWAPSQVVRYRVEHLPAVSRQWRATDFDWKRDEGWRYQYLIVRHSAPLQDAPFEMNGCPLRHLRSSGNWSVFELPVCMNIRSAADRSCQASPASKCED